MTAEALGRRDPRMADGLAAAIDESTNRGHREDTIRSGAFLSDQDIVASVTSSAVREADLLERRGVIFRRDLRACLRCVGCQGTANPASWAQAMPMHVNSSRCWKSSACAMAWSVAAIEVPLRLVHTGQRVQGLVVADLTGGRVLGLQCKALILADGGASDLAHTGRGGYGLALALEADLPLRDMEFLASTPLGVRDTAMTLPLGLLADGAIVCESDGSPIDLGDDMTSAVNAVRTAKEAVIDLRSLGEARPWYDATFRLLAQRVGVDADRQTVAIEARAYASLGGIPVDEEGRAVIGSWSRWFTVVCCRRNRLHGPPWRRPLAGEPRSRRPDVRASRRDLSRGMVGRPSAWRPACGGRCRRASGSRRCRDDDACGRRRRRDPHRCRPRRSVP